MKWNQTGKKIVDERGMVLVVALLVIAVLVLLGSTAIMSTNTDMRIAGNYRESAKAFYDAEAGTQWIIAKIGGGAVASWPANPGDQVTVPAISTSVPSGFFFDSSVLLKCLGINRYMFSMTGRSGSASRKIEISFSRKSGIPLGGLNTAGLLDLKPNSKVYSYDSQDPKWASVMPTNISDSTHDAEVMSNTSVILGSGAFVDGTVVNGANQDPDPLGVLTPGGLLYPKFSTYAASNDNATQGTGFTGNAVNTSGAVTVTLSGKAGGSNFYFTQLSINSNAVLRIDTTKGPVNIWLAGNATTNNTATIQYTGKATDFSLYGNSACTSIYLMNNGGFSGLIYAPNAAIEMKGGTTLYGLLWGKTLKINSDSIFWVDEGIKYNFNNLGITVDVNNHSGKQGFAWRDVM